MSESNLVPIEGKKRPEGAVLEDVRLGLLATIQQLNNFPGIATNRDGASAIRELAHAHHLLTE